MRADDVTIADLTVRRAFNHPIHVTGGAGDHTERTRILNVAVVDPGQQAIKINGSGAGTWADDGVVACSRIELTDEGRANVRDNCYTGGVDAHGARGWRVYQNEVRGFWCQHGLSEHGIHFWRGSRDTVVERNTLLDNVRGIGFGLGSGSADGERVYDDAPDCGSPDAYFGHFGGMVRNNFVAVGDPRVFDAQARADSGIGLEAVCDTTIAHNTVAFTRDPGSSSIEFRHPQTRLLLANNLTTHRLIARDGARTMSISNVEEAPREYFRDV